MSDLHLTDAQPFDPKRPLWKRFKSADFFIDRSFDRFLGRIRTQAEGEPIELVLAGDTFDFDSVVALPEDPSFPISWLEARRGLDAAEAKSLFKMQVILDTHRLWVDASRRFLEAGHRVVFIIGNHDIELHWPSVQRLLRERLGCAEDDPRIVFCEWFYISGSDTLIEHGNQYDAYCVCSDPVWPFIEKKGELYVRTPFGNLASRIMVNGMGMFNPNVDDSFIMSGWQYARFFFKHVVRQQPFLLFTWFWSAMATLLFSLREGLLPSKRDALHLEERIDDIARRANATPRIVRALKTLHTHPAIYNPLMILRELWLDRAVLFLAILWASFQVFALVNVFVSLRAWWIILPLLILMPMFIFYARSVRSNISVAERQALETAEQLARIAGVRNVVFGHTHHALHRPKDGVEVVNTGAWSPAFRDLECTEPFGTKRYACIRPSGEGAPRKIELVTWTEGEASGAPARSRACSGSKPLRLNPRKSVPSA